MVRVTRVVCPVDAFLCLNKALSRLDDNLKLEKFNNFKVPLRLFEGLNDT